MCYLQGLTGTVKYEISVKILIFVCFSNVWECDKCKNRESELEIERREQEFLTLANTKPFPYNIRTCLQQLHDLSKVYIVQYLDQLTNRVYHS